MTSTSTAATIEADPTVRNLAPRDGVDQGYAKLDVLLDSRLPASDVEVQA